MDKEKIYDPASIKTLTERFFDATIRSEEMDVLLTVASCPEKFLKGKPDDALEADLTVIASLGTASENILAADIPSGLEQKLESHISRLSGRSAFRRKWIYPVSAAAAVAAIITTGINLTDYTTDTPGQTAEVHTGSPAISPASPSAEREFLRSGTGIASVPAPAAPASISGKTRKLKIPEDINKPQDTERTEPTQIHDILPTFSRIPPVSDLVADITPTLSTVTIDPAWILAQPLSTLSQSVDNVYESLDIVAKAFSGVNASIASAAEGIAPISDLPLHSI